MLLLTSISQKNSKADDMGEFGRALSVRNFIEVLRFANCPEPPRFYAEFVMRESDGAEVPFTASDHKSLFFTALVEARSVKNGPSDKECGSLTKPLGQSNPGTPEGTPRKGGAGGGIAMELYGAAGANLLAMGLPGGAVGVEVAIKGLCQLEEWQSAYSRILADCRAIHESNKTESKSIYSDSVLRARRRIAGNAVYRQEVLRFDREQQRFVDAEVLDIQQAHLEKFEEKMASQRLVMDDAKPNLSPAETRAAEEAERVRAELAQMRLQRLEEAAANAALDDASSIGTATFASSSDLARAKTFGQSVSTCSRRRSFGSVSSSRSKSLSVKSKGRQGFALPKKKKKSFARDAEFDKRLIATVHQRRVIASQSLIGSGAYIEARGSTPNCSVGAATPLIMAARFGDKAMAKMLLKMKANVHAEDAVGWDSLMSAVNTGNIQLSQMLLRHRASTAHTAKDGTSPLMVACRQGHTKIAIALLMEDDVVASHQSDDGKSALSLATQFGRSLCVDALLSAKVDVDTCDIYGDTPLHQASRNGFSDIATALLDAEADPGIQNESGKTPLDVAKSNRDNRLVSLLQEPNARGRQRVLKTFKNAQHMLLMQVRGTDALPRLSNTSAANDADRQALQGKLMQLKSKREAKEKAKQEKELVCLVAAIYF
eukprot:INCI8233.1.p1 GENE.INCI8233.1~~INCI8233.1.p1  ORF type:complete len:658 (-),score=121.32 INCI8233.1:2026-3999(-)